MKSFFITMLVFSFCTVGHGQIVMKNISDTASIKRAAFTFEPRDFNAARYDLPIPMNFYAQHLPFFCTQELKMQQVHVPLTFRLGSMDQCNYLEQKPGYR